MFLSTSTMMGARESMWRLLGDLCTKVMVFVALMSSKLHVNAHKEALGGGLRVHHHALGNSHTPT